MSRFVSKGSASNPQNSTVSVNAATKHRLEKLAKIAGRSGSFLAAEAISEYLDVNETQASRTPSPRSIRAKRLA
jgi:RHH-type rel operon transcriptional repressor/antitoxin RelB